MSELSRSTSLKKNIAVLVVAAIWFGMLLGVSFLATPAKFMAPSLALPVALDVGRQTFIVFNRAEWVLSAAFLLLFAFTSPRSLLSSGGAIVAVLIVVAETLWLLPVLDARVGLIIGGEHPAPTYHHVLFIGLEAAKAVAILIVMADMARYAARQPVQT